MEEAMPAINLSYRVPQEKVSEIESIINEHAEFMKKTYVDNDEVVPPTHTYFTKAAELVNPTDPEQGLTGYTIFTVNEIWNSPDDVMAHINRAMEAPHFERFKSAMQYAHVAPMGEITFKI